MLSFSTVTWLDIGVVCCILDIDPERPSIMFQNSDRNETESFYDGLFQLATGKLAPINKNAHSQTEWMIRILKRYKTVGPNVTTFISTLLNHAPGHWYLIDHDGTNLLKEVFLFEDKPNAEILKTLMSIVCKLSPTEIVNNDLNRLMFDYIW